jgi:hypothetical protein
MDFVKRAMRLLNDRASRRPYEVKYSLVTVGIQPRPWDLLEALLPLSIFLSNKISWLPTLRIRKYVVLFIGLSIVAALSDTFRCVYLYDDRIPQPFWSHLLGVAFLVGAVENHVTGVLGLIWVLGLW